MKAPEFNWYVSNSCHRPRRFQARRNLWLMLLNALDSLDTCPYFECWHAVVPQALWASGSDPIVLLGVVPGSQCERNKAVCLCNTLRLPLFVTII